ncbi:MAG: hypothetical protein HRU22_06145 [Gammaproteobacteria bacterium]|nr:hypothetical protein [Gammaproteobacteria bacterium]
MSNSINRFAVNSTNNKAEDKWFAVTFFTILAIATALLSWQTLDKQQAHHILPTAISPIINQLSNAGDEILFLIDADLLPTPPTLLQLQADGVSPFDSRKFSQPTANCFVTDITTDTTQYQVALWLKVNGYQLGWRTEQSGHQHPDIKDQCQQTHQGWQLINHLATVSHP